MRRIVMLLAIAVLALGLTGAVAAAEDALPHSGRVLIVAGGDVEVAADEQADAVLVFGGDARIAGTVNTLLVIDGTATVDGATIETIAIAEGTAELIGETTVLGDVLEFRATVERADGVAIGGTVRDMAGDIAAFGIFMGRCPFNAAVCMDYNGVGTNCVKGGWRKLINFPGSDWYADSYFLLEGVDLRPEKDERSWLGRIWKSIF